MQRKTISKKPLLALLLLILLALSAACAAIAHAGRTDANGDHWNRKTGEYHYHNGGSSKA